MCSPLHLKVMRTLISLIIRSFANLEKLFVLFVAFETQIELITFVVLQVGLLLTVQMI